MSSLDRDARLAVMASVLYYGLDLPMMTDSEYDAITRRLHDNWDQLGSDRQWMLGGEAGVILTTGNLCRVTEHCWGAVQAWINLNRPDDERRLVVIKRHRIAKLGWTIRYWAPTDFRLII